MNKLYRKVAALVEAIMSAGAVVHQGELVEEVPALPGATRERVVGIDRSVQQNMIKKEMSDAEKESDDLWLSLDADICPKCGCGKDVPKHPEKFLTFYRIARGGDALNMACRHCQARFWFSGLRCFGAKFQGYDTTDGQPAANEFTADWDTGLMTWHYVSDNSGWDTSELKLQ